MAFITQKNLWFDEVFSWHLSLDSFYEIIVRTSNDIHPPLFYFTLKIWNFVFGDACGKVFNHYGQKINRNFSFKTVHEASIEETNYTPLLGARNNTSPYNIEQQLLEWGKGVLVCGGGN